MAEGSPIEGSTAAEWRRFLAARQGDEDAAREMLVAHVQWRRDNFPLPADAPMLGSQLPDFVTVLEGHRSCDGTRVLLVHGAMYDATAGSHAEYALALAALFDMHIDRDSEEKFTVLVDARGGDGWPNPRPWAVLPWLRVLSSTLSANYPERLHRLVVCPVPWVASAMWTAVSAFLDERTAAKVALVSGPAARTEPLPAAIDEYLDAPAVKACEAVRVARFATAAAAGGVASKDPPPVAADADYGLAELELA